MPDKQSRQVSGAVLHSVSIVRAEQGCTGSLLERLPEGASLLECG